FFVAAAWCFSRADERLENWLLGLPVVGRLVDDYRAGLGMPRTTKVVVSCIILLAVSLSAAFVDRSWVAIAILVTGAFGIGWVLFKVPTRESQVER
ncbi:MAG TPA: YbaN family protein, partial [Microthrixaceae bacterium]|nr:YbaN family protein [Microthrixaceae bacterium]